MLRGQFKPLPSVLRESLLPSLVLGQAQRSRHRWDKSYGPQIQLGDKFPVQDGVFHPTFGF